MMLTVPSRTTGAAVATVSASFAFGAGSGELVFGASSLFALCAALGAFALGSSALGWGAGAASTGAGFAGAASALGAIATCTTGGDAGFASSSRWLRAITPVPTMSVKASGATTNSLLFTARTSGQCLGLTLRNGGMLSVGSRIVCFGGGIGTVRRRPPVFLLIA